MTNISKLGQEFGQYLIQLMAELMLPSGEQPRSLSEMERNIREMLGLDQDATVLKVTNLWPNPTLVPIPQFGE